MAVSEELLNYIDNYIEKHYVEEKPKKPRRRRYMEDCCLGYIDGSTLGSIDECDGALIMDGALHPFDDEDNEEDYPWQVYLFKKIDEKHLKDPEVYKSVKISKQTFSKIRSDIYYHPDRDTAILLCIALKLNLRETNELLNKAGYCLSNSIKRDVCIRGLIVKREYNIDDIEEVLYHNNFKTLCRA